MGQITKSSKYSKVTTVPNGTLKEDRKGTIFMEGSAVQPNVPAFPGATIISAIKTVDKLPAQQRNSTVKQGKMVRHQHGRAQCSVVQHCLLLKVNWISEECKKIEAEDQVGDDGDDDDDGNIEKDKTK